MFSQTRLAREFLIAPSILSANFAKLESEIQLVEDAGAALIHVDVMDGHFVPNLTIGAPVVKCLKPITRLPLDCHLMVENPDQYLEDFAEAGAHFLTVHIEATKDPKQTLKKIRELGMKPGLTLKPQTKVEELFPYLELVDLVLIMTVNPGFSGQKFLPDQMVKLTRVKQELKRCQLTALLEVDGGVNLETVQYLREADILVCGNAVYRPSGMAAASSRSAAIATAVRELKASKDQSKINLRKTNE